jgi:hypothetical protein
MTMPVTELCSSELNLFADESVQEAEARREERRKMARISVQPRHDLDPRAVMMCQEAPCHSRLTGGPVRCRFGIMITVPIAVR